MWLFTLPSALEMDEGPEFIALRYLAALVVARLGVGLVFRIVRGYAAPILAEGGADEETDADDEAAATEPTSFDRRRTDQLSDDMGDRDQQRLDDALDEAHGAATLVSEPAA
jgi:hypothetical protein